jgi:hypothetical protein
MTKYRDFGSGKNTGEKEPVTFKLHDEEFSCREQLQGKALLDLVARAGSEDPAESAKTITLFFEQVLLEESYKRFDALLNHPEKIVTVEALGEISGWLVEVYAGRPEGEPEVS